MSEHRAYSKVIAMVECVGGRMDYMPGGAGGGGTWRISVGGRTREVSVHGDDANDLDRLYVPDVESPRKSHHYTDELFDDAFWRLADLLNGPVDA